ncbi:MAG: transposase [Ktedonobacteraceae bacterium]
MRKHGNGTDLRQSIQTGSGATGAHEWQIADDLGVSNGTLSKWCQDAETNGERAFVGSGHQQPEAEELKRLRREMEILRQECDILKKRI